MSQLGEDLTDWLYFTEHHPGKVHVEAPRPEAVAESEEQQSWYLIQFQLCTLGFSLALSITWFGCSEMCVINRGLQPSPLYTLSTQRSKWRNMYKRYITNFVIGTITLIARTMLPPIFVVPVSHGKQEVHRAREALTGQRGCVATSSRKTTEHNLFQRKEYQRSCKVTTQLTTTKSWAARIMSYKSSSSSSSNSSDGSGVLRLKDVSKISKTDMKNALCGPQNNVRKVLDKHERSNTKVLSESLLSGHNEPIVDNTCGYAPVDNTCGYAPKRCSPTQTDPLSYFTGNDTYTHGNFRGVSSGNGNSFSDSDSKTTVIVKAVDTTDSMKLLECIPSNSPYTPPIRYIDIGQTRAITLTTNSLVEEIDRKDRTEYKSVYRSSYISQDGESNCMSLGFQRMLLNPDIEDATCDLLSGDLSLIANKYSTMDDEQSSSNISLLCKQAKYEDHKYYKHKKEVINKQKEQEQHKQNKIQDEIQEHEIQEHEIQEHEIQEHEIQEHEIQEHEIQEHEIQECYKMNAASQQTGQLVKSRSDCLFFSQTNSTFRSDLNAVKDTKASNRYHARLQNDRIPSDLKVDDLVPTLPETECLESSLLQRSRSWHEERVENEQFPDTDNKQLSTLYQDNGKRIPNKDIESSKDLVYRKCLNQRQTAELHYKSSTTLARPLTNSDRKSHTTISIKINQSPILPVQRRNFGTDVLQDIPRRLTQMHKTPKASPNPPQTALKIPKKFLPSPKKVQRKQKRLMKSPRKTPPVKLSKIPLNAELESYQSSFNQQDNLKTSTCQAARKSRLSAHQQSAHPFLIHSKDASTALKSIYEKNDNLPKDIKGPIRRKSFKKKFWPYSIAQRRCKRNNTKQVPHMTHWVSVDGHRAVDRNRPTGVDVDQPKSVEMDRRSKDAYVSKMKPHTETSHDLLKTTSKRDAMVSTSLTGEQRTSYNTEDAVAFLSVLLHLPKFIQKQVKGTAGDAPSSHVLQHSKSLDVKIPRNDVPKPTIDKCAMDALTAKTSAESICLREEKNASFSEKQLSTSATIDKQLETRLGKPIEQNISETISKDKEHQVGTSMGEAERFEDSSSRTIQSVLVPGQQESKYREEILQTLHGKEHNRFRGLRYRRRHHKISAGLSPSTHRESCSGVAINIIHTSTSCAGNLDRRKCLKEEADFESRSMFINRLHAPMTDTPLVSPEAEVPCNGCDHRHRKSKIPVYMSTRSRLMQGNVTSEGRSESRREAPGVHACVESTGGAAEGARRAHRVSWKVKSRLPVVITKNPVVKMENKNKHKYQVMVSKLSKDERFKSGVLRSACPQGDKKNFRTHHVSASKTVLPHNQITQHALVSKKCKDDIELSSPRFQMKLEVKPGLGHGKVCPTLAQNKDLRSENSKYVRTRTHWSPRPAMTESADWVTPDVSLTNKHVSPVFMNRERFDVTCPAEGNVRFKSEQQEGNIQDTGAITRGEHVHREVNKLLEHVQCTDSQWLSSGSEETLLMSLERLKCKLRDIKSQINEGPYDVYASQIENFQRKSHGQCMFDNISERIDTVLAEKDFASKIDASFREVSNLYKTRNLKRARNTLLKSERLVHVDVNRAQASESGFATAVSSTEVLQNTDVSFTKRSLPRNIKSKLSCSEVRKCFKICDDFDPNMEPGKHAKLRTGTGNQGAKSHEISVTNFGTRSGNNDIANSNWDVNLSLSLGKTTEDEKVAPSQHQCHGAEQLGDFKLIKSLESLYLDLASPSNPIASQQGINLLLSGSPDRVNGQQEYFEDCNFNLQKSMQHSDSSWTYLPAAPENEAVPLSPSSSSHTNRPRGQTSCKQEPNKGCPSSQKSGTKYKDDISCRSYRVQNAKSQEASCIRLAIGRTLKADMQGNERRCKPTTFCQQRRRDISKESQKLPEAVSTDKHEMKDKATKPNALSKIEHESHALSGPSCCESNDYKTQNSIRYQTLRRQKKDYHYIQMKEEGESTLSAQQQSSHNSNRNKEETGAPAAAHHVTDNRRTVQRLQSPKSTISPNYSSSSRDNKRRVSSSILQKDDAHSNSSKENRCTYWQQLSNRSNSLSNAGCSSPALEHFASPTYNFTEVDCPDQTNCRRTKLVRKVPEEILFSSAMRRPSSSWNKSHNKLFHKSKDNKMARCENQSAYGRSSAARIEHNLNHETGPRSGSVTGVCQQNVPSFHDKLQDPTEQHSRHKHRSLRRLSDTVRPHVYAGQDTSMHSSLHGSMASKILSEAKIASKKIQSDFDFSRIRRISLTAGGDKSKNIAGHYENRSKNLFQRHTCTNSCSCACDTPDDEKTKALTSTSVPALLDRDSSIKTLHLSRFPTEHLFSDLPKSSVPGLQILQSVRQQETPPKRKENLSERDQALESYRRSCSRQSDHAIRLFIEKPTNASTNPEATNAKPQRRCQAKNIRSPDDTRTCSLSGHGCTPLDQIPMDADESGKTSRHWHYKPVNSLTTQARCSAFHRHFMTSESAEDSEHAKLEYSKTSIDNTLTDCQLGSYSYGASQGSDAAVNNHSHRISHFVYPYSSDLPEKKFREIPNRVINMEVGQQCTNMAAKWAKCNSQVSTSLCLSGTKEVTPTQKTFSTNTESMGNNGEHNSSQMMSASHRLQTAQINKGLNSLNKVANVFEYNRHIQQGTTPHILQCDNKIHQEKVLEKRRKSPYFKENIHKIKSEMSAAVRSSKPVRQVSSNVPVCNTGHLGVSRSAQRETLSGGEQLFVSHTVNKQSWVQTNRLSCSQNIRENKGDTEQVNSGVNENQVCTGERECNISMKRNHGYRSTDKSSRLKSSKLAWPGDFLAHRSSRCCLPGNFNSQLSTRSNVSPNWYRPLKLVSSQLRLPTNQSETLLQHSQVGARPGLLSLINDTARRRASGRQKEQTTLHGGQAAYSKSSMYTSRASNDNEYNAPLTSTAEDRSVSDRAFKDVLPSKASNDAPLSTENSMLQSSIILSPNSPSRSRVSFKAEAQSRQERYDSTERNEAPPRSNAAKNLETYIRGKKFTPEWASDIPSSSVTTYQPYVTFVNRDDFKTQADTSLRQSAASTNISQPNSYSSSPGNRMFYCYSRKENMSSSSSSQSLSMKDKCLPQHSVICQTKTRDEAAQASNSTQTTNYFYKNLGSKFSYLCPDAREDEFVKKRSPVTFQLGGKHLRNLKIKAPKEDTFVGKIVQMFEKKFTFLPSHDSQRPTADRAVD